MVVRLLDERGIDLHLARQHRLEVVGHLVPMRDLRRDQESQRQQPQIDQKKGDPPPGQLLLEGAGLGVGSHEHRHLAQGVPGLQL